MFDEKSYLCAEGRKNGGVINRQVDGRLAPALLFVPVVVIFKYSRL